MSSTGDIPAKLQTEFEGASYADLFTFIETLPSPTSKAEWFMVLDELPIRDHEVTIIHKGLEVLNEDGEVDEEDLHMDFLTKRRVWKIHRVPSEKTQELWACLPRERETQYVYTLQAG
jgi:hypothetical protein